MHLPELCEQHHGSWAFYEVAIRHSTQTLKGKGLIRDGGEKYTKKFVSATATATATHVSKGRKSPPGSTSIKMDIKSSRFLGISR
jgi:hypothetical protein